MRIFTSVEKAEDGSPVLSIKDFGKITLSTLNSLTLVKTDATVENYNDDLRLAANHIEQLPTADDFMVAYAVGSIYRLLAPYKSLYRYITEDTLDEFLQELFLHCEYLADKFSYTSIHNARKLVHLTSMRTNPTLLNVFGVYDYPCEHPDSRIIITKLNINYYSTRNKYMTAIEYYNMPDKIVEVLTGIVVLCSELERKESTTQIGHTTVISTNLISVYKVKDGIAIAGNTISDALRRDLTHVFKGVNFRQLYLYELGFKKFHVFPKDNDIRSIDLDLDSGTFIYEGASHFVADLTDFLNNQFFNN